jgi:hypothetical protein
MGAALSSCGLGGELLERPKHPRGTKKSMIGAAMRPETQAASIVFARRRLHNRAQRFGNAGYRVAYVRGNAGVRAQRSRFADSGG